ncbi:bcl-2-related protein A1 [Podarcis raffonei]|uniref:bcl-2-related protein A1 n=1 Tax=Podarcis raffonei TaxID=65483 RepID=UPI0023292C99|nr:bcl-2-related protein A1 [Podarcis raffonei]
MKRLKLLSSALKQPENHLKLYCRGQSLHFALCAHFSMENNQLQSVYTLVQDYLKHVCEDAELDAAPSRVAQVLARVAPSLQEDVEVKIKPLWRSIKISSVEEASGIFNQVMAQEFADGNTNWGRILTIFVFAGIIAKKLQQHGVPLTRENVEPICHCVTEFINTKATWISENGGWDNFLAKLGEEKSPWLALHYIKTKLISAFSFFSQYY